MTTVLDIQNRLQALGFDPGPADGFIGPQTLSAMGLALDRITPGLPSATTVQPTPKPDVGQFIPDEWMPPADMQRLILHWSAGAHKASEFDREHYHVLIEGDGGAVRGIPPISGNSANAARGKKASHTRYCNTGSIGLSMCCMADAVERPFNAGKFPLTKEQWGAASTAAAELCRRYRIPVTSRTVLSHAEVQPNLGIVQSGKWDVAILPFDPAFDTARECGDRFRAEVSAKLAA